MKTAWGLVCYIVGMRLLVVGLRHIPEDMLREMLAKALDGVDDATLHNADKWISGAWARRSESGWLSRGGEAARERSAS